MLKPSRWSIQTVLGVLIGVIGLLLIAVSLQTLLEAGRRYADSRRIAALSAITKPLLTAMIAARVERGTLANGMLGDGPIDDASLAVIADTRREVEENYRDALQGLGAVDVPGLADIGATLRATHDAAAALRARADEAVRQPKLQRDATIVRDQPVVFQNWVNALLAASNFVEPAMMMADPTVDQLLSIKRAAWAIRLAAAGQIMSPTEGIVSSGRALTAADNLMFAEGRGRVLQAWDTLAAAAVRPDSPADIVAAIKHAEQAYLGFLNGEEKNYIETLNAGRKLDIGFSELQRRDTVAAVAVADVAKTALRVLRDHADAEMRRNRFILTLNAGLLVVAAGFVGAGILIVRWRIARPLLAMTGAMRRLAGHDLAVAIPGAGRGDEIGAMAGAVQVFRDSMLQADRLAEAQRAAQAQLEARTLRVEQLNRVFEESVRQALDTLASAANELTATAGSMSDIVTEATRQAAAVAAASDQASANVQTVSAATEQLSASIKEISRQIGQSSAVSGQAVNEAAETAATMRNLSDAAQKIGDVVQLISDIAGRTNLLALNATIEAARAGDAGKGFAVVASEVKSLATQTARATQDITTQVAAMQSSATASVEAITRIDKTISRMNEIVSAISAAVDEQSSATSEIARNVQNTASHTAKVSGNIGGLSRVVEQNGQAAMHVQGAAGELGRQSQTLRNQVDVFLAEIRAA